MSRPYNEIEKDAFEAISKRHVDVFFPLADELEGHEDPLSEGLCRLLRGYYHVYQGEHQAAIPEFLAGVARVESLEYSDVKKELFSMSAAAYHFMGDSNNALIWFDRSLHLSLDANDEKGIGASLSNLGLFYFDAGDYPTALENYRRALPYHERAQSKRNVAITTGNIGYALQQAGYAEEALPELERAFELHMGEDYATGAAPVAAAIADIMWHLDQEDRAIFWAERGAELAEQQQDKRVRANCRRRLAVVHTRAGELDQALKVLDSISELEPLDALVLGDAMIQKAEVLERLERITDSASLARQALAIADERGLTFTKARVHKLLKDLAKQQGDFDAYITHNEEHQRLQEQLSGAAASRKIAVMDAQAALERSRAERERERAILYSALPQEIADRLIRGENVSGDEHQHAAVLFADIVGFTSHSASMSASETSALLDTIFAAFDAICDAHGMLKIKTIGDSYMAVAFERGEGLSAEGLEVELRAATAALEMAASEFYWPTAVSNSDSNNQQQQPTATANSNRVQFRMGLHSGPVVAGVIGKQRLQYDVWGDTVNTASRMESTGEPGRIQVSSEFHELLRNRAGSPVSDLRSPTFTERGEVDIKGKGQMTTYWLEAAP